MCPYKKAKESLKKIAIVNPLLVPNAVFLGSLLEKKKASK